MEEKYQIVREKNAVDCARNTSLITIFVKFSLYTFKKSWTYEIRLLYFDSISISELLGGQTDSSVSQILHPADKKLKIRGQANQPTPKILYRQQGKCYQTYM